MRKLFATVSALAVLGASTTPAIACGPPPLGPSYVDAFGGQTGDLNAFYAGRIGLVMAQSPRARLFMDWRLLHGQPVGAGAGAGLSIPCCDSADPDTWDATDAWLKARGQVAGVVGGGDNTSIVTDLPLPDGSSRPNCFVDAFTNATVTLNARIASYGASSAWVKAWVDGQDAVFTACGGTAATLPPLAAGAPDWLKADRAYQAAALVLYQGDNATAAADFVAIGHDPASPWRAMAPYLTARALLRQAKLTRTPPAYAAADQAVDALASAPASAFGQANAAGMQRFLLERQDPPKALAELQAELTAPQLTPDAAGAFRDYVDLNDKVTPSPEILDWIATIKASTQGAPTPDDTADPATQNAVLQRAQAFSLAHAEARWQATSDPAWLIAALSLADPSDPTAPALAAEAANVAPTSPAYVTAAYQRVRLTIDAAPEADTRSFLNAMLARTDLSTSDRNLFTAQRMQVADDETRFAQLALRTRLCADDTGADGCVRGKFNEEEEWTTIYDASGTLGLGPDAMALIDRMPLAERAALATDADLPAELRLDIGLTSWTRAVLEQDDGQINALSLALEPLLPAENANLAAVVKTPSGPAKRFAEFFIMAQMPGLATDLMSYTRPTGSLASWQGNWPDWMILPKGATNGDFTPPCLLEYLPDGVCEGEGVVSDAALWPTADVVCLTYCGSGAAPMRLPDFLAARSDQAAAEWKSLAQPYQDNDTLGSAVWEEVFAYANAHPTDPRSPEAFYWLVHVTRYGHTHDHISHRSYDVLHTRYPTSTWAKKTPYYFD
jgi:hypothetical protein